MPERIGTALGNVFQFGKDLVSINRSWDKGNGTTYNADIVALHRIAGSTAQPFGCGDDITINDEIMGEIYQRRIIVYQKCVDNPTFDSVTLGVFVRDSADNAVRLQVDLNNLQSDIDNRIIEGEQYSNVSIDRINGFQAVRQDGQVKTVQNATDCFAVMVWENGEWVKRKSAVDEFGLWANRIGDVKDKTAYAQIGWTNYQGSGLYLPGLQMYHGDVNFFTAMMHLNGDGFFLANKDHLVMYSTEDATGVTYKGGRTGIEFNANGIKFTKDFAPYGHNAPVTIGNATLHISSGIITSVTWT